MSALNTQVRTLLASVPLLIYMKDKYVSLYRVQGMSMAPTLQHGDVVLVRKCDWSLFNEDQQQVKQLETLHDVRFVPLLVPGQICVYQIRRPGLPTIRISSALSVWEGSM